MTNATLTYKASGVDIDAANQLVEHIKTTAKKTHQPGVMNGIGGFSALFELPLHDYKHPILVSSTDGVGTKLKVALAAKQHYGIGIDLVAMSANDILVSGAKPLFFLDYYATGHLDLHTAKEVINGIAEGCLQAGAALVGGETAEMPGIYVGEEYDLAGFCVGIVEKSALIDGSKTAPGDTLIAIGSTGPHANGFSLIRHIIQVTNTSLNSPFGASTLADVLLAPTKIYVNSILTLMKKCEIKSLAHITGGGIYENLPRVLPAGCQAVIDTTTWEWPEIFHWLQSKGNLAQNEMYRTFNCGIGMILCVAKKDAEMAVNALTSLGEKAWICGSIIASQDIPASVIIN